MRPKQVESKRACLRPTTAGAINPNSEAFSENNTQFGAGSGVFVAAPLSRGGDVDLSLLPLVCARRATPAARTVLGSKAVPRSFRGVESLKLRPIPIKPDFVQQLEIDLKSTADTFRLHGRTEISVETQECLNLWGKPYRYSQRCEEAVPANIRAGCPEDPASPVGKLSINRKSDTFILMLPADFQLRNDLEAAHRGGTGDSISEVACQGTLVL